MRKTMQFFYRYILIIYKRDIYHAKHEEKLRAMVNNIFNSTNKQEALWNNSSIQTNVVSQNQTPAIFPAKCEKTAQSNQYKADVNSLFEIPGSQKEDGLAKELPGWYVLKDDAARQQQLNSYLSQFKTADEQIAEVKRLIGKAKTQTDMVLLNGTLGSLQKDAQLPSVGALLDNNNLSRKDKTASDNETAKNLRYLHEDNQIKAEKMVMQKTEKETKIIMAQEVPNFAVKNQVAGTEVIVATKDEDITDTLAQVAYKTDKSVQTEVAKTLFNSGFEKIQTTIAQTEGKYDKENQIELYKTLMTSQYQNVLEEAAKNIYTFDKNNQLTAVNITKETQNEGAINAAASQITKYDEQYRTQIKDSLSSSGYDSVKQTIAQAEADAKAAEAKVQAQKESQEEAQEEAEGQAEAEAQKQTIQDNQRETVVEKVKTIINSKESNKDSLIKDAIKGASEAEKIALISSLSPNELFGILDFILQDSPSLEVLSKVMTVLDGTDDKRKNEFVQKVNKTYASRIMGNQIGLLSPTLQNAFVEEKLQKGEFADLSLQKVNKNFLSNSVKTKYTALFNK